MKILIVDDSSTFRSIARSELLKGGYEIFEARNGREAVDFLAENTVDLMTLDVEMPELDGYETFQELRSDDFAKRMGMMPDIPPVIFITSNDSMAERRKGFEVGAADFITKPFLAGELLRSVKAILNPESRFKGLTALIADDSKTIRSLLADILSKEGMNVLQAENGEQAFELYQEKRGKIDLVLTDFQMPKMNGLELCKKIRNVLNDKDTTIIMLSGSADQGDILDVFKVGATDYLNKPFPKEELLARINVHMNVRLLNQQLHKNISQLKNLSKMKDEFLAICSHDLRNPLAAIQGFTNLMLEMECSPIEKEEYLKTIKSSSEFLLNLIEELLDISRIHMGAGDLELVPLNIADIAQACKNSMQPMATVKQLDFSLENKTGQATKISGNVNALTRVINNLISNAIKFTPKNGKVAIVIDSESGNVSLSVADSGLGIPEKKISHLFDQFSSLSKPGTEGEKGTGLGMSIIKELVEKQHGQIEVKSKEGEGSHFKVIFPAAS